MTKKTNINKALLIIATLAIALTAQIAFAAYDNSITYSTCSLGIYPYNQTGNVVSELEKQWFNLFSGPDKKCTDHLVYPNKYTPETPVPKDNPLVNKSGIENIKAENARHNHIYHNATKEDQYYYKTWIDRFELTLGQDTLNNTEKANVVCYTPKEGGGEIATPGCNGDINNQWGGTKISYNQSTGIITWKFAMSGKGRPWVWGNNTSLSTTNGLFPASVKLISKNNPQEIWSATTTSRILIRDQAILKNNNAPKEKVLDKDGIGACTNDGKPNSSYNYNGTWCTLPAPKFDGVLGNLNDSDTGDKTYYWFRIGIVGTVWAKPTTEEKPEYACASIELSPQSVNPPSTNGGKTDYTAKVLFKDGNGQIVTNQTFNTTVTWSGNNGTFKDPTQTKATNGNSNPFQNAFTATSVPADVTVKVTNIDGAQNSPACQTGQTVYSSLNCEKLDVTLSKDPITEGDSSISITAIPTFNPKDFNKGGVKWAINGGSLQKNALSPQTCPQFINPNTPTSAPTGCFYNYTPGLAYSTLKLEADPNTNTNPACKFDKVVQPPKDAGPGGSVDIGEGNEQGGSTDVDNQDTDEGSAGE